MARILIVEPHPEVHDLLVRVVRRLGHRALRPEDGDLGDAAAEVAIVEPASDGALERALRLRARGVEVVFVSIRPESAETGAVDPAAYVLKPFTVAQIARAIEAALTRRELAPSQRA